MATQTRARTRKLSVFADDDLLKKIRREKADSNGNLTIEEIANARLRLSYESHPGPLNQEALEPVVSA